MGKGVTRLQWKVEVRWACPMGSGAKDETQQLPETPPKADRELGSTLASLPPTRSSSSRASPKWSRRQQTWDPGTPASSIRLPAVQMDLRANRSGLTCTERVGGIHSWDEINQPTLWCEVGTSKSPSTFLETAQYLEYWHKKENDPEHSVL